MADSLLPIAILCGLVFFGLFYMTGQYVVSYMDEEINTLIDTSMFGSDAVAHYTLMEWIFAFIPFAFCAGTLLFMFERAKGGMIPMETYLAYVKMLVIGIVISIGLVFTIGLIFPYLENELINNIPIINMSNNAAFATIVSKMFDDMTFINNIVYIIAEFIGFVSTVIFMIFPVILQLDLGFNSVNMFRRDDTETQAPNDAYSVLQQN